MVIEPGTGRHKGRLGALLVEMANGTRFCIGTGFTDAQRDKPPPVGTMVHFKFQEMTDSGVPRFPSFRFVPPMSNRSTCFREEKPTMATSATKRRFECVSDRSDKFWEVEVNGTEVVVRYGRNGTDGQADTKTFPDEAAANKHAEKKIAEKVKKGYVEVK